MAREQRTPAGHQAEAERKASGSREWKRLERARKKTAGLKPAEIWGYPDVLEQVKKYASRLQARAERERG